MDDNPLEIQYKLKIWKSQRGNQLIIQENKHIFHYSNKKKDNSNLSKFPVCKQSIKCNVYDILDIYNNFNQDDYNLEHTEHDEKQKEIQILLEINTMKDIINKSYNKFSLKPTTIIIEITSKISSINLKYINLRQNIYNQSKRHIPKDPIDISHINKNDDTFLDSKGENILIYKYLNILAFTNNNLIRIVYDNKNDLF